MYKKYTAIFCPEVRRKLLSYLRIMKMIFVLLLITLHVHASLLGQTVNLTRRKASLREVLKEIRKQSGVNILMDATVIDLTKPITVQLNNVSVEEALKQVLRPQGLTYQRMDKNIIVSIEDEMQGNVKEPTPIVKTGLRQRGQVVGTVRDNKGGPIPGVSVLLKGTNLGVQTDANGNYRIPVEKEEVLIFSLMGYATIEVPTKGRTKVDVVLQEESQQMEEVVVTGYSTIQKRHVASSVVEMNMDRATNRPIFKMQEAFSGTLPGVTLMQGSNMPGKVPGTIAIRGVSTLQGAEPLVIVDGMEQSLTDLDPNQIKSINVLKDAASASLYGSRGANGVIIIETKRGSTGQFKVDLHAWSAFNEPIKLPDWVGSADYMRLNNEARKMQGQSENFSPEQIAQADQGQYPETNWLDAVMQKRAKSQNFTSSISGGGGVGTFNLMLGYINEGGLNAYEGTEKFSARFNTNINVADKFVLLADFYAHRLQVDRLQLGDINSDPSDDWLYQDAWKMNPTQPIFYDSDRPEHYILHNNLNPVASIAHGGRRNNMYDVSTINLRPKYFIKSNLFLEGNVSYTIDKSASKIKRSTFMFYDADGKPAATWANNVGAKQGVSVSQLTARANVNYEQDLRGKKDKLYLIAGSEIMNYNYTDYREVSKASFFAKVNYAFDNRYLLEVTGRSDGSSKFAPGHRWGFFPSAAVAWNVDNENFFESIRSSGAVTAMKLRISYGLVGNENVDPYLWQENVNDWGWTERVPNPEFSWEKQKQWNVGLDVKALNDRLTFTGEVYKKHSYDLIYSRFPVPPLTGSNGLESAVNIGEVDNKGWELSAQWSDRLGELHYAVGGMLFDNRNKVLKAGYGANDTLIFKDNENKIWYPGIALDNYYGYQSNGYFQTQEEVDRTSAKLPNTLPGDIRYVDQNGDGVINDQDRVNLGDPFPHMNYAINIDLQYKRWDFSVMGQGVGKRTGWINGLEGYPVLVDGGDNSLGAPRQEYMENRWTPETPNSRFPRVWTGASSNAVLSDVWLSNAAFFRIKMIQIGYTIPKIGNSIKSIRVYLNAQDAFTFTKWEGLEPERDGGNGTYPRMAIFSVGLRATIL
ncbi:SusC/RagA family TonB-linked outer membrane protein [Olivibacter sp. CPCC 100613]|uniref:SusC/RagA family TonB-linked outer membrane protein n=1 Tax=Olivibacter sp. CPCC 100613 TaxID=3079931 RepID=UPI002FFC6352